MSSWNSVNIVMIARQRDESGPHGPLRLLTLEQTNKQTNKHNFIFSVVYIIIIFRVCFIMQLVKHKQSENLA